MREKRHNKISSKLAAFLIMAVLSLTACSSGLNSSGSMETGAKASAQSNITPEAGESSLQIHYIDVGQGDATLLICDGDAMLIDAGDNDKGTAVQQYLNSQKVTELKYVIGTHPDSDHIGGLDVIITKFDCQTIFLTDEQKDTNTYRDVLDAVRYRGYQKVTPEVGEEYNLGSAKFTIEGPVEPGSDSNDNSIAILLEHGENRFYFEGDAGEKEEASILSTGRDLHADVYKIGHHGSRTSTCDEMLSAVDPEYAVISVGEDNSYGHPNAEVMNKLRAKGVQVFRTDEQGSIVAFSDGTSITWNSTSSDSWQAGEATGGASESEEESMESDNGSDGSVTVHITKSGTKYHVQGCRHLSKSDMEISLTDALERGYEPCSDCNPPQE